MALNETYQRILFVILIILAFGLEPFYRQSLFDATIQDVPRMQQKQRLYGFFEGITFLGEAYIPIFFLVIVFNVSHKMNALYIWATFGFICYLNSGILKSLYAESRPFWVSEDIKPSKCRKDFGNPSGHCMTAAFFWITLYLNKYYDIGAKVKIKSIFCTAYIVKMGLTAGLILFLMFLALSRVFLGEHSYNQVVFGSCLGTVFAFALHFMFKAFVKSFPNRNRHEAVSTQSSNSTYNISWLLIVASQVLLIIMPLMLAYGIWYYQKEHDVINSNVDQRVKAFCGDDKYLYTGGRHNKSLQSSGIIGLTGGAIIGQLFEMKFLDLNLSYGMWMKTNILFVAIRSVICIVVYGIFALPYFLISSNVDESQIYYLWFVKYYLPTFSYAFMLFAFGRLFFYKLKLVSERSIGRMFQLNDDEDDSVTAGGSSSKLGSNSLEFMEMEMAQKL